MVVRKRATACCFTKSLGTGVISTAIKKGVAKQAWIDAAVSINDDAEQELPPK